MITKRQLAHAPGIPERRFGRPREGWAGRRDPRSSRL